MNRRAGFVFPTVLAVIAIMAIVAAASVMGARSALNAANQERLRAENDRNFDSAEARALFLTMAEPMGIGGVRVGGYRTTVREFAGFPPNPPPPGLNDPEYMGRFVPFDGRRWRVTVEGAREPFYVEFQDNAGLVDLNLAEPPAIALVLRYAGIEETRAATLADRLVDYRDQDREPRLAGAEAADYAAARRPAPADDRLVRPWEALAVLGWADALNADQRERLLDNVTSWAGGPFNPNTARPVSIAAYYGISIEAAESALHERGDTVYANATDFARAARLPLPETESGGASPGPVRWFRIRLGTANDRRQREVVVHLSPLDDVRPYWIVGRRWRYASEQPPTRDEIDALPDLPEPAGEPAR